MNQDERIAELIKLNTQAFITIDAAKEVILKYSKQINYDLLFELGLLLNDFQELHCNIEENLMELVKHEKI